MNSFKCKCIARGRISQRDLFFGCPHLGNLVVTLSPTEKFVRKLDLKCPKVDCSYLISARYTGLISSMPNFSSTTCNTENFNTSLDLAPSRYESDLSNEVLQDFQWQFIAKLLAIKVPSQKLLGSLCRFQLKLLCLSKIRGPSRVLANFEGL